MMLSLSQLPLFNTDSDAYMGGVSSEKPVLPVANCCAKRPLTGQQLERTNNRKKYLLYIDNILWYK